MGEGPSAGPEAREVREANERSNSDNEVTMEGPVSRGSQSSDTLTYFRLGEDHEVTHDMTNICIPIGRIAKIENLENCLNLEELSLTSSYISKIENLDNNLKLKTLEFYQNRINKIENISHLSNLIVFDMSFNLVKKIENLESLVNLKKLFLSSNKITKICGLETLVNLELLELGSNRIRVIENIDSLTNLNELWLGKNKITTMEIPHLPNLRQLSIQSNRICDWHESLFKNASSLEELYLSNNNLSTPPQSMICLTSLKWLDLAFNKVVAMGPIVSLVSLTELWLNDNLIESVEEVKKLENLRQLETIYLEGNPIKARLGPSYRRTIMSLLPWLTQLDAWDVKQMFERAVAEQNKSNVKSIMKS